MQNIKKKMKNLKVNKRYMMKKLKIANSVY